MGDKHATCQGRCATPRRRSRALTEVVMAPKICHYRGKDDAAIRTQCQERVPVRYVPAPVFSNPMTRAWCHDLFFLSSDSPPPKGFSRAELSFDLRDTQVQSSDLVTAHDVQIPQDRPEPLERRLLEG